MSYFDDLFGNWDRELDRIHEDHKKMDDEFRRLCAEPSTKIPVVGSRVVVAAGLLGMGFNWVRYEGIVEECGDTSYKVRFTDYHMPNYRRWVHQALITDVLDPVEPTQ
jgi:hypothetical protein